MDHDIDWLAKIWGFIGFGQGSRREDVGTRGKCGEGIGGAKETDGGDAGDRAGRKDQEAKASLFQSKL